MNTFGPIRTLASFLAAATLLLLLGCGIFDSSKGELRPIEGNIIFRFEEDYQDHGAISEPRIVLSMVTEKWYPCCNWSIRSQVIVQNREVLIRLFGIYVPEVCATAVGPAASRSLLNISTGEYSIFFSYRDVTDSYSLTVTDSSIQITDQISRFTKPKSELLWRYPSNSFAYLCGTTTETSWMCEDFLDTLFGEIDLEEFQFPDSGEIPYPCSSAGHHYDTPARYFFYDKDEDFDKAGEMLRSYTQDVIMPQSGIGISLIGWRNQRHLSWLLDD
jgi:hypothetical protein